MTNSVKKRAYAKINLYLEVKDKLDDRHEIETLMQSIDLYDDLTLSKSDGQRVVSNFPNDNAVLVVEHLMRLFRTTAFTFAIETTKRIPIGGGLGGSSADAAAAALAFSELREINDPEKIRFFLSRVFSDISFQMTGGTAIVRKTGEWVESLAPLPRFYVLLAFPHGGVSTAEAYRLSDEMPKGSGGDLKALLNALYRGEKAQAYYRNDLLAPAMALNADIAPLLDAMRDENSLLTGMSGSGSTLFSLYLDRTDAEKKAATLSRETLITETIPTIR